MLLKFLHERMWYALVHGTIFQQLRDCILPHSRATRFASRVCLRQSTVGFAFITLSLFHIRYSEDDIDELHAIYVCLCCCRSLYKEGRSFHFSPQHSHLSISSNPLHQFFHWGPLAQYHYESSSISSISQPLFVERALRRGRLADLNMVGDKPQNDEADARSA